MKGLTAYFIKYPVAVNTVMVLIFIFGIFGLRSTRSSLFPEVESRTIQVQIIYPGAAPEEVEEGVVLRIEDDVKGVSGVERVSSVSQENGGIITVEVVKGYDTDAVLQDVKNAVDRIPQLPEGMEPIRTFKLENIRPAVSFALSGEGVDLRALKTMARRVEQDLRSVDGLSKVELSGFPEEEIEVAFREADLRANNLSFVQAAAAVRAANLDVTGGKIKTSDEELLIRVRDKRVEAEGLRNTVVRAGADGRMLRLQDVADVRDAWADDPARNYVNGVPSVVVTVSSTVSEDILFIAETTLKYMEDFNARGSAVKATLISDATTVLRQRIEMLVENGLQGFVLVLVTLALFLNWRLAFWVAVGIPVAFAGMFILAPSAITINVMSLFGMILVVGILVDDGIVITESIYQEFERGHPPVQAAFIGIRKVLPAVVSSVLTTVAAFSTFFFIEGRLGDFAPALAFVTIATLGFSLVEAAFTLPAHVAHSKGLTRQKNRFEARMDGFMGWLREKRYGPFFDRIMRHKMLTVGICFFLLAVTIGFVGKGVIKTTFFPVIERDDVAVDLEMVTGTRESIVLSELQRMEQLVWKLNDELSANREDSQDVVLKVQSMLGPRAEQGKLNIILLDGEQRGFRAEDFSNRIREMAGTVPGVQNLTFGLATPFGKPVSVSLRSNELSELNAAKTELRSELQELPSLRDVVDSDRPGNREVVLQLKEKAFLLGLNAQEIAGQVRQGFFGLETQRVQRGEDEVKIQVRFAEAARASLRDLEDMRIRTIDGRQIPLSELVTYHIERGIRAINHLDGKREVRVEADLASSAQSATDAQGVIAAEVMPPLLAKYPGLSYSFEGQGEQSRKVGTSAMRVMPITLIIMFAMIVITLRSFWQMLVVLLCIPFGFIGIAWGHWLHGVQISLFSFFGMIALIGVMVNDSLVLLSTFNDNMKERMPFHEALRTAALSRLRPILLTSLTTVAGLLPITLNKSFQAQFLIPMAITVAYGLAIATFVTLILIPVLMAVLNELRRFMGWAWNAERPSAESVEPAVIELPYENLEDHREH
ncbi:MAG: efflux RND transporter permease subunit [Flavobacteriales bacterium]|jgi:multidrug efflux pump subunit AcrB|nr:efflux RND transporter permease subunit [Flavobacteriales bacterium]